jgi:hypothetical protein
VELAGAGVQAPGCRMSWGSMAALEEAYSAVVQGTSFPCFTSTNGETLTGEEVEAFSGACLSAGLAAWHQVSHSSEAEERLKRGLSSA